ncbi:uncharacterized protein LOC116012876 [Ipomoea triloba]|uniref:uncharacterized protein LOC116012876 n=1 Tax=Ipomoea triloba TaxID=35885 RepID=UPI00125E7321|nr:uncharacterized protein LOC116012876 [Ipomoea triloba]
MLVSNKKKNGGQNKKPQQTKKTTNPRHSSNNKFGVLAEEAEEGELNQQSKKGNAKPPNPKVFVNNSQQKVVQTSRGYARNRNVPNTYANTSAPQPAVLPSPRQNINSRGSTQPQGRGFAGGLLLLWNQSNINLEIVGHTSQSIHSKVKQGSDDLFITFSYVRPNLLAKTGFWENCSLFGNNIQGPWVILGDFNDIASTDGQWGSDTISNSSPQRFVDAFSLCGLLDMGFSGPKFTWCRSVGNKITQLRRLDRIFWIVRVQMAFPECKAATLPRVYSDHNPVLFIDEAGSPPDINTRPRCFEAMWLTRDDYSSIWREAAQSTNNNIVDIIVDLSEKSFPWNRNVFKYPSKNNPPLNRSWTDDPTVISLHINDFFTSLFRRTEREEYSDMSNINDCHKIPTAQANRLSRRAAPAEV